MSFTNIAVKKIIEYYNKQITTTVTNNLRQKVIEYQKYCCRTFELFFGECAGNLILQKVPKSDKQRQKRDFRQE